MILNRALDIQRGSVPTDFVYHGTVLIWQRSSPVPPWHGYEQDKIAIVVLDENGNDTSDVHYESTMLAAKIYCTQLYDEAPNTKIAWYWGDDYLGTMPNTNDVERSFYYIWATFGGAWANMIYRFKYPKSFKYYFRWMYDMRYYYNIGFISSIPTSEGQTDGLKYNVKEVIMPKISDINNPNNYVPIDGFKDCTSLNKLIIEDASNVYCDQYNAFENCVSLENIEISLLDPNVGHSVEPSSFKNCASLQTITIHGVQYINGTGENAPFYGCDSLRTITIDNGGVQIPGAPWGAPAGCHVIYV